MKTAEEMKREEYAFAYNINSTGMSGIITMTNPPTLVCYCDEENSKIILNALNPLPPAEGAKEILPEFGDYCTIEQKRYGCANEHYTHKVIGTLRSNSWVDVPVQSPATETIHVTKALEPVVACVCEGISEREILRYRISDIRNLKKPAALHAQQIADKMVSERLREELGKFIKWYNSGYEQARKPHLIVKEYLKSREK